VVFHLNASVSIHNGGCVHPCTTRNTRPVNNTRQRLRHGIRQHEHTLPSLVKQTGKSSTPLPPAKTPFIFRKLIGFVSFSIHSPFGFNRVSSIFPSFRYTSRTSHSEPGLSFWIRREIRLGLIGSTSGARSTIMKYCLIWLSSALQLSLEFSTARRLRPDLMSDNALPIVENRPVQAHSVNHARFQPRVPTG